MARSASASRSTSRGCSSESSAASFSARFWYSRASLANVFTSLCSCANDLITLARALGQKVVLLLQLVITLLDAAGEQPDDQRNQGQRAQARQQQLPRDEAHVDGHHDEIEQGVDADQHAHPEKLAAGVDVGRRKR